MLLFHEGPQQFKVKRINVVDDNNRRLAHGHLTGALVALEAFAHHAGRLHQRRQCGFLGLDRSQFGLDLGGLGFGLTLFGTLGGAGTTRSSFFIVPEPLQFASCCLRAASASASLLARCSASWRCL